MPTHRERLEGGLLGLLIGDALGVPYEFHNPGDLPTAAEIEFAPPAGFARAHPGVPPGTWSDDGAQALVLLASLLDCGKLDLEDFGRRLVAWRTTGYLAVDAQVFDVGGQTGEALYHLMTGTPAEQAGNRAERANGNGSLMRVLPLVLWHQGSDEALVADAQRQSQVTHGHIRSQVCCALYCLWARRTLQAIPNPWTAAVTTLHAIYELGSPETFELDETIHPEKFVKGTGGGYVVDCLRSAWWAVEQGNYEQVVKAAVGLGDDTDTTACVAGGIAGVRDGIAAIPGRWRRNLRGQELAAPLMERLLQGHSLA